MQNLQYNFRLCIHSGDRYGEFGPGIASLLRGVEKTGSLLKAAEAMGMAYSKAWKSLKKVEENLDIVLITRETGRGHGSALTREGLDFLNAYQAFYKDIKVAAEASFQEHFSLSKATEDPAE